MKRALRAQALAARKLGFGPIGPRLAEHFLSAIDCPPGSVVAGYWPMGEEADSRPLLEALGRRGCILGLPVVVARGAALEFRRWSPDADLEAGPHGTRHPPVTAPLVEPDLLLVPLLAFDRQGGRLGYGGGYYDRTLAGLRAARRVLAVGLAFAAQEMPQVPCDGHDQRLDWIITEESAMETLG